MRKYILFLAVMVIISFLLSACNNEKSESITHLAYQETEKGKWGIMDCTEGNIVVPPIFSNVTTASLDGMFYTVRDDEMLELRSIKEPQKIIDVYSSATWFVNGVAYAVKKGEGISCINKKGDVLYRMPSDVILAMPAGNGMVGVANKDGKYGFVDSQGKIVIPFKFERISSFSNGYALAVENESNIYYIDEKGDKVTNINGDNKEETLHFIYDNINLWGGQPIYNGVVPYVANGNNFGLKKMSGEIIVPADEKYKMINSSIDGGYYVFETNNGCGIMDRNGKVVVKDKYQFIKSCNVNNSGVIIACRENKFGILSINKKQICPFEYDFILDIGGPLFVSRKGDAYFLITKTGKIKRQMNKLFATSGFTAKSELL